MQKITFENSVNGLSATFSTDTPAWFLADFDGSSTACTAITYKPADFDGERFISANLDAKTITFTANWYGVSGGKYSASAANAFREELQRVFVPGQMGKLTWTNGTKSRFIECRTVEFPVIKRIFGSCFSAEFKLVADYPYWQGEVHSYVFEGIYPAYRAINLTNSCGVAVPFVFTSTHPYIALALYNPRSGVIALTEGNYSGALAVDTRKCLVTLNGEAANQYLSPQSTFFKLPPGDFEMRILNVSSQAQINAGTNLTWHDCYIGVG